MNFVPEEEIRKDFRIAKDAFWGEANRRGITPIELKREIGAKYGLSPKECSKSNNIVIAILEYLREIRKTKSNFSNDDIHDFYMLTDYVSRYDKLEAYLNLESGKFLSHVLENEKEYLLSKGIKEYTLNNIDTIALSNDITHGSGQLRFWLERYKSIKKYYDEHYGHKMEQALNTNNALLDLYTKILEETYESRLMLEQYLLDFINECYDVFNINSKEYKEIVELIEHYLDLVHQKYPVYNPKHVLDEEEIKYISYVNALNLLMYAYNYFNPSNDKISQELRIEKSIDYFNTQFDKICLKNIVKTLISKNINNANDIKISKLIQENEDLFYFTIDYNDKKLYVNFALYHENLDFLNLDKFAKLSKEKENHINFFNWSIINYEIKVTSKPINKNLNESFDFNNLNFALDDFDNDLESTPKKEQVKSNDLLKEYLDLSKEFIDLGLPSGTWWGRSNLGADCGQFSGDWFGTYFAWGETKEKDKFNELTYKFTGKMNKYNKYDNIVNLEPEDDVAHKILHIHNFNIHIPTKELCEELIKYTDKEWVKNYNKVEGLNGCKYISKINGKEIFIPAAGYIFFMGFEDSGTKAIVMSASNAKDKGRIDCCWSLLADYDNEFNTLTGVYINWCNYRTSGLPVRPVCNIS